MYKLFVSDGWVLGKRGFGEANALTVILTKEFGLLRAAARSARVEKSKLRYGLEPLTRAHFTFVRGKQEWKLTGVQHVSRALLLAPREARAVAGRASKLLLRLIQGEEPVVELFKTVDEGFEAVARVQALQEIKSVESGLVLRILAHLGYLPELPALAPFVEDDKFSPELALQAAASRKLLIKLINDSLQATGL